MDGVTLTLRAEEGTAAGAVAALVRVVKGAFDDHPRREQILRGERLRSQGRRSPMPVRLLARSLFPLPFALTILAAPAAPVAAQDLYSPLASWSAVGSAGVMDDSSVGVLTIEGPAAWFRTTAPAQSIGVLRYPIDRITSSTCVNGFCGNYTKLTLTLTFVKNDEQAYVSAVIYRVNPSNGAVSSYRAVNTLDAPAGLGGQSVSRTFTCGSVCFDPAFIHYVEVVLWKPLATSAPKFIAM